MSKITREQILKAPAFRIRLRWRGEQMKPKSKDVREAVEACMDALADGNPIEREDASLALCGTKRPTRAEFLEGVRWARGVGIGIVPEDDAEGT